MKNVIRKSDYGKIIKAIRKVLVTAKETMESMEYIGFDALCVSLRGNRYIYMDVTVEIQLHNAFTEAAEDVEVQYSINPLARITYADGREVETEINVDYISECVFS